MKKPFVWDIYSDQPSQLKDREYKKKMRKKEWFSLLKTTLISLSILPFALLLSPFMGRKKINGTEFFALGVNLDKEPNTAPYLIEELGVKKLLIRIPLWEMEKLNEYVTFIQTFKDKHITVALLQDREHITSPSMTKDHFTQIFEALEGICETYIIGSTINRAKWGFFSVNEYLNFYAIAYSLKKERFPHLKLIGSNVIDFEYHFTVHSLFNFFQLRYDGVGALLYVDRRGAPENKQMGFSLFEKISLLASILQLSPKTEDKLYITETNWPISGTAPYAPTSETECVDEESYADFMVRYYCIAFASQHVDTVYWHQLIAPGYGLIDNREGLRKRSAYGAFKTMIDHLYSASFIQLKQNNNRYTLICQTNRGLLHVVWSLIEQSITFETEVVAFSRDGQQSYQNHFIIGSSPVYIYPEHIHAF